MRPSLLAAALVCLALVACSDDPSTSTDGGTAGKTDGGTLVDAGTLNPDAGPLPDGGGQPTETFSVFCSGQPTTISGTVWAPNGTDPVVGAEVAIWTSRPDPLPRGVACDNCNRTPEPNRVLRARSATDGTFTLVLDPAPKAESYFVTVRKARFRRVLEPVSIAACGDTALTSEQTRLPSTSEEGDLPRIAISTGNRDHLEKVVEAMGITEYDCVRGLSRSSQDETCTSPTTLGDLLANPAALNQYAMVFIACAPADTYEPDSFDHVAARGLRDWTRAGGRLVVTDDSYDFIEQAFPDAIEWQGTAADPGSPQPPDTGEIGTYAYNLSGVVADPDLAEWLRFFPGAIGAGNLVRLEGFLSNWAVIKSVAPTTEVVVHGQASWTGGSGDVPLTTLFEVDACGRVIFSSYHTNGSPTATLLPQERILQYLLFEVGDCTGPQ